MMKKVRRALAIILALFLTGSTFADHFVSARAENFAKGITNGLAEEKQEDSLNISITINGKDISEVTTIHQDDAIEIAINWIISDGELGGESGDGRQVIKEIYLTPTVNVNIPDMDERPLRDTKNRRIGYVTVKNNVVTMVINDEYFLYTEKGRRAKGLIEGTIDTGGEDHETGEKVPVQIGEYVNKEFDWDNNEENSWLTISKSAEELSYVNGKWVQTYSVKVTNYGGTSTITEIVDESGSALGNWHLVSAKSDREDTELTNTGQPKSIADILQGLTVKANENITLTYTMEVMGGPESVFTETYDSLKNTLRGTWRDNKNQDHDFNQQVSLNVTKPSVTKTIVDGSTDEEQNWKITINLGDAAKAGMELKDVVERIDELLGDGLEYLDQSLSVDNFNETPKGSGIYEATITTKLTDEYIESESTVVKNKVKIKAKYWQDEITSNEASYITKGNGDSASISKSAEGFDETTSKIRWKVVLQGLPADARDVSVQDWVGADHSWEKVRGEHSLLNTLIVDDKTVIYEGAVTPDAKDIIQTEYSWGETIPYDTLAQVYFLDTFIASHAGSDITLYYETKVANTTAMKNVWFFNTAQLNYNVKGTNKSLQDSAEYQNESAAEDALAKTGVADDDTETITYTLTIDMDKVSVDSEGNGAIVITDELVEGKGLVYVEGSAEIEDRFGNQPLQDGRTYYDPQEKEFWRDYTEDSDKRARSYLVSEYSATVTAQYEKNANKITFTIPAEKLAIKKAYRDYIEEKDGYSPAYSLVITYKMEVEDVSEFVKNGQTVKYINQADGTYSGQSLNRPGHPATATNTLTPENVIGKTGTFVKENNNHEYNTVVFTVDVNPGARDLSEESLTAIDRLSKDLTYDLTTIHVYEMDGSIEPLELNQGLGDDEYSFVFDPFNNSLTFTLPDAKHLQITYVAKANVIRESGTPAKEITIENSFELQGYTSNNMKDGVSFQATAVADRWLALSEKGSIQLYKYWDSGSGMQAVIGSVFEVYRTKIGANGLLEVDWENRINPDQKYEVVKQPQPATDLYGGVTINNLDYNTCYALVEVVGGVGKNGEQMAVQEKPYFFVIEGSDRPMDDVPVNCTKFVGGGFFYYPNEKQAEQANTITVKISKTDINGTKELSGAKLEVRDLGGKLIEEWLSVEGEAHEIELLPGTYTLTELIAPNGYQIAEKITFKVYANGNIQKTSTTGELEGSTLIMRDAPIEISLHKVDDHHGHPVAGAEISVYRAEDMDGKMPKANAKPVYSDTTPEDGTLSFGIELAANADGTPKEYVIVETYTPDTHYTATPIHIWVQADGTVVRADDPITSIDMMDVPKNAEVGTLVITKTISGDLTYQDIRDDLVFHVKGPDGETTEYSIRKFEKGSDNKYTLTLEGMELGTYEVWETVEDSYGVKCTTKYTITTNNEPPETEEEMAPDKHVEITLAQTGDVVTVAYENNYRYIKGTILLRKSFASSADTLKWDDIKGTLTFLVYEGDVIEGKEPVAKVRGDAAGWTKVTGEENQWEYELEHKIGTYTVIEECDSIGDYVSTTTYTMNNKSYTGTEVANVTVTEDATTTVAYSNTYVSLVYISKKAITGTEEIDRPATLIVSGQANDGSPFSDKWDTGKEPHKLQLMPGKYKLAEDSAPQGYAKAKDIEFTINDKGDIVITSNQANSLDGRTITMWDAPLSLKLNKMALVTNERGAALSGENKVGEPLKGAEIEIYEVKADQSREFMTSWTSAGTNTPHDFGPELYAGRSYVLVERQAPQDYLVAKEIAFSIADDGTVKVSGVQNNNYYQGSDGVIYMLDKKSDKPLASLVLTKSIKGIDYADVNGLLSFKVECVSGEGVGYEDTFTIGAQGYSGFTWDGEKYIRLVANLAPGSYKVTESWIDSDSIVCHERSYTINITRDGKEYPISTPVKDSNNSTGQFSTIEFSLAGGNSAEVNFENTYDSPNNQPNDPSDGSPVVPPDNPPGGPQDDPPNQPPHELTYEKKGTLVITKTISGDITMEEVEGTLTFTVTENSTGKKNTYTLKNDFVYNSTTKQWTKELVLTAGGYTVEESGSTLDGKTCAATYTVNGGTQSNGTLVQNVVLEQGRTTTVAYTNTYTSDSSVLTSLIKTGDGARIGLWLLLLLFGVAEAIDAGYALRHRKKD